MGVDGFGTFASVGVSGAGVDAWDDLPDGKTASAPDDATGLAPGEVEHAARLSDALSDALRGRLRHDPRAWRRALALAFSGKAEPDALAALAAAGARGTLPLPARVRLLPSERFGGGERGAYAGGDGGTVYLDERLLAERDPAVLERVLAEEVGHHLDAVLGGADARGDEGAIFAAALLGKAPRGAALAALRAEDDRGVLHVDGRRVEVEFSADELGEDVLDAKTLGGELEHALLDRGTVEGGAAVDVVDIGADVGFAAETEFELEPWGGGELSLGGEDTGVDRFAFEELSFEGLSVEETDWKVEGDANRSSELPESDIRFGDPLPEGMEYRFAEPGEVAPLSPLFWTMMSPFGDGEPIFSHLSPDNGGDLHVLFGGDPQPPVATFRFTADIDFESLRIAADPALRFDGFAPDDAAPLEVPYLPGDPRDSGEGGRGGPDETVSKRPTEIPSNTLSVPDSSGEVADGNAELPPPPPIGDASTSESPEALTAGLSIGPLLKKSLERLNDPEVRENIKKVLPWLRKAGSTAQSATNYERILEISALFSHTALSTDIAALVEAIDGVSSTDPYEYLIDLATDSLAPLEGARNLSVHSENLLGENARLRLGDADNDILQNALNFEIYRIGAAAYAREHDQASNTERGKLLPAGKGREERWNREQFETMIENHREEIEAETGEPLPATYEEAVAQGLFGKDGLINASRTGFFVSEGTLYRPYSEEQAIFGLPDLVDVAEFPDAVPAPTFVTGVERPTYEGVRAHLIETGAIDADTTYIHPADFADGLAALTGQQIGGEALDIAVDMQNRQLGDQLLALGAAEVYSGLNMAHTGALAPDRVAAEDLERNTTALVYYQDDIDRLIEALPDDPELQNRVTNAINAGTPQALGEALPDQYRIAKAVLAPRSVEHEPGTPEARFFELTGRIDVAIRDGAPEAEIEGMLEELAETHVRLYGPHVGDKDVDSLTLERILANTPSLLADIDSGRIKITEGDKPSIKFTPSTAVNVRYSQTFRNAINTAWKANVHLHSSRLDGIGTTRPDIEADTVRHVVRMLNEKIVRVQEAQIERAVEANLSIRRENGETARSNERTALDVRADIRLASDVFGYSEINGYWLEQMVLRGSLNPDRPFGFADPIAYAERQLELMRTTTVQDLVPESDDTRTLEQVYRDARGGGTELTAEAMAGSATPQDFPFARDAKNGTGWYLPPDLTNEIVENSLDYVAFEDSSALLAFRPVHFEPSELLLQGGTEEIVAEANRLAVNYAERSGFDDPAAIIGEPIELPSDTLRTARVADGVLRIERDIAQRIGSIDARPIGGELTDGLALTNYAGIEQVGKEAQRLKSRLDQWKLALGEHDPLAEVALDHVLDGTALDPDNPYHDFLVEDLKLAPEKGRLRGVAPISVFSDYDRMRSSSFEFDRGATIGTEPEVLAGSVAKWLEGIWGGVNASVDTEFKLDTLYMHNLLGAFSGNNADPGISPQAPAAFYADQANAEIALALLGQDQDRAERRNAAGRVTREQLNAANAVGTEVDNALFLNSLYRQSQDLRPWVVAIERARLTRDGHLTEDEWLDSQLQLIDRVLAAPELAGLNARQVEALQDVRDRARLDSDVIGYGEHQTFVVADSGGVSNGFEVYGGDPDAFAPFDREEIEAGAAGVGEVDVPADVVARTGTPLATLDFVGLAPREARELAERHYLGEVDPDGSLGIEVGDRFAFIEESAAGVEAYDAAVEIDGQITATANNHTAGVDLSDPELARNKAVVIQEGRAETILMSLEHPDIAVKLTGGEALDALERSIVEERYPVVRMVFNDQERLQEGLGTTDIEIWRQNLGAAGNNAAQGFGGLSPATSRTLERLDVSIRELVADGDAYRGGLSKVHGVDRFVDPSVQAAVREEDSKAYNRTVERNEKILADNAPDTQTAADLRNRAEAQTIELVPLETTFTFEGRALNVVTPNTLQQQQLVELTPEELAAGEAAAAQVIAYHDGTERRVGELVPTGLGDARLPLGRPFLDVEKGVLYFYQPAIDAIRQAEKRPGFESGDVGQRGQAIPQATRESPASVAGTNGAQDPIIEAQRDLESFNEVLGEWRVQIEAATDRMSDPADKADPWQEFLKAVLDVRNDAGKLEAVIAAHRGEAVAPRYADLPILDGFVGEQQALNEAALNVETGSYNSRMRAADEVDEAIDGVNGAGIVPRPSDSPLRNPRTDNLFDGKEAVPLEFDFSPGGELFETDPFSLINPFAGPANAITTLPLPTSDSAPSGTWPPPSSPPEDGSGGKSPKLNGDAFVSAYEQWIAIVAGESNNARKQPLPTIDTERVKLRFDDTVTIDAEQLPLFERQGEQRDNLVIAEGNLHKQTFAIDESLRIASLDQGSEWRRTEVQRSVVDESVLRPLEQKESARSEEQAALREEFYFPGTDMKVEEVVALFYPDGVPDGVVLPWIDAGTGEVYLPPALANQVLATLPEFAYAEPPTVEAQVPTEPLTVRPVSKIGDGIVEHGSPTPELDLEANALEVTNLAQNAVIEQVKPSQAAVIRRTRESDLRLFRQHEPAMKALAAARAEDGTHEGKTVEDYVDELPFDVEQALDKYIGRRFTSAEKWGLPWGDPDTKDERDHAVRHGLFGFDWTRIPLNRQSLFVLAEDFQLSRELDVVESVDTATIGFTESTGAFFDLVNERNDVAGTLNARILGQAEQRQNDVRARITEINAARGAIGTRLDAYAEREEGFTQQVEQHTALGENLDSEAEYELSYRTLVERGEIDPDEIPFEDYDFARHPIYYGAGDAVYYPEGWRKRVIGEPPAIVPSDLSGSVGEIPSLFDYERAVDLIVPLDPDATVRNLKEAFAEEGVLLTTRAGEGGIDRALAVEADYERRRIAIVTFGLAHGYAANEVLDAGASTGGRKSPVSSGRIASTRAAAAFERFAADRGFLTGPSVQGQKEIYDMFVLLARGDEEGARSVLDSLDDDSLAERFADYIDGDLRDFAQPSGTLQTEQNIRDR